MLVVAFVLYALANLTKESAASRRPSCFSALLSSPTGALFGRVATALPARPPVYAGGAVVLLGRLPCARSPCWAARSSGAETGIFEVENPLAPLAAAAPLPQRLAVWSSGISAAWPFRCGSRPTSPPGRSAPAGPQASLVWASRAVARGARGGLSLWRLPRRSRAALGFLLLATGLAADVQSALSDRNDLRGARWRTCLRRVSA